MSDFYCICDVADQRQPPGGPHNLRGYAMPAGHDQLIWRRCRDRNWFVRETDTGPSVQVANVSTQWAIGCIRVDNRADVERQVANCSGLESDLTLALRLIAQNGIESVERIVGDFAFVGGDDRTGDFYAVRDALGVHVLYHRQLENKYAFCTLASPLVGSVEYDKDFIAEFLINGMDQCGRTIYRDVRELQPASIISVRSGGAARVRSYWSPTTYRERRQRCENPVEAFRDAFTRAVAGRHAANGSTWAHLSGGLDSSSVVAISQTLAEKGAVARGLDGTITMIDTISNRDEVKYAEAVLERYPLRNERIVDAWAWAEDDEGLPTTDTPEVNFPAALVIKRMYSVARDNGATVLLTGCGADAYLSGSLFYIADLLARGRVLATATEVGRWATSMRTSLWRSIFQLAVRPLMPGPLQVALSPKRKRQVPSWIAAQFNKSYRLDERLAVWRQSRVRRGCQFLADFESRVRSLPALIERGVSRAILETRHPFISRPLVELCIGLDPTTLRRPLEKKLILREAMRGMLPEIVRARRVKATMGTRYLWSLRHEHAKLSAMLRDPILAQLDCVEPSALRDAFTQAQQGRTTRSVGLGTVLALETWLSVTSGRWVVRPSATPQQSCA